MKITIIIFLSVLFIRQINAQSYSDAVKSLENKNYEAAFDIAEKLINIDSTDQALKILLQLQENNYQPEKVLEGIGDTYNKMGVLELAIENYSNAMKMDSLNVLLRYKIGKVLYNQKKYTDAANEYLKIISIDSTYMPAYQNLGDLLYFAKEFGNAAYYLNKFLNTDKSLNEYIYAAQSYFNIHNFNKSFELSEKGLDSFPRNLVLLKLKAESQISLKNYNDALTTYNSLPDSIFSASEFAGIGEAYQAANEDSVALIFLNKAYSKDSSLTEIYSPLGNLNLRSKNFERALYFYNKKISAEPASLSSYVNAALCLIQMQKYNDAKSYLLKALDKKKDYMPANIWMARNYRMMDSTNKAFEVYSNILLMTKGKEDDFKTEVSESYGNLGYKYLLHKNYPDAIDNLKSAVLYNPSTAQYHLWLAEAYALNGKKAEAIKEYKAVLSIEPDNKDAAKGIKLISE